MIAFTFAPAREDDFERLLALRLLVQPGAELGQLIVPLEVDLQLDRVRKRLAKQGLALALTEEAKEFIGNQGYDPVYGARPLKRAIQHLLLDPLSLDVLDGKFADGDVIRAELDHGSILFAKA
jgi:ATP-dependent Clp protease ATP-binding subunit ClpA